MSASKALQWFGAVAGTSMLGQLAPTILGCPGITSWWTRRRRPVPTGRIVLTFDDGPHPQGTPAVLDLLAARGVAATFFVVGEQLRRFPDLGPRITGAGHELAVHGWDHQPLPFKAPHATVSNIVDTVTAITDLTGVRPRWYRPPYGTATSAALLAAQHLGLRPLLWTRWGRDWTPTATPQTISARLLAGYRPAGAGEVLLLHDSDTYGTPGSWRHTALALDQVLKVAHARGQRFVTASQAFGNDHMRVPQDEPIPDQLLHR